MKTRARSTTVFVNCLRVFGYPGWTRVPVIHMIDFSNEPERGINLEKSVFNGCIFLENKK